MWNDKIKLITKFRKFNSITQEELEEIVKKYSGTFETRRKVVVEMIDIGWLYADKKSFAEIVPVLSKICDQKNSYVESPLIKYMLDAFWKQY